MLQLNWTKIDDRKMWGVECEKFQVSFRFRHIPPAEFVVSCGNKHYHSCMTTQYIHSCKMCTLYLCCQNSHPGKNVRQQPVSNMPVWVVTGMVACTDPSDKRFLLHRTPCHGRVYDALPPESRIAHAQLLQPKDPKQRRACVLHLAGTGDHSWNRRLHLGGPLLQKVSQSWCFYLRITQQVTQPNECCLSRKCTVAVGFLQECLPRKYNSNLFAIPLII